MRRLLLFGLALAVLLGALVVWLRGPIALRVMRRAVERNMTLDPIAELGDGLHAVLCGAGGPLPDTRRSGPCVAVIAGRSLYVVDAGSSAARNLSRMRLPPARIEAVFLTHFHSDHIDGLGELALQRWIGGTHEQPLPLVGPTGVDDVATGFERAYRADAGYRTAHHGANIAPPTGAGFAPAAFPPPPPDSASVVFESGGLRVSAFVVQHEPASPAVGYRFEYGGRSLVISGDTRRSEQVEREARGADLLVHEALSARLVGVLGEAAGAAGRANLEKIMRDIPGYHTTPVEAAELAQAAGVGHLLYYHVVPPLPLPGLESVFLEGVSDAFSGGITLGRDGTTVSLPSGSQAIELSER